MRLIDAEVLKKCLEKERSYGGVKTDEFDKGYDLGVETAIEMLDNAPTVEPKITEVDNVSPCTNCQEFDCYGCKVKEADNEITN